MNGRNGDRSPWDELNHNCPNRFAEITRWRVGNMARSMFPPRSDDRHELRGQILAEETAAYLRLVDRKRTARAEGWHGGEPGE